MVESSSPSLWLTPVAFVVMVLFSSPARTLNVARWTWEEPYPVGASLEAVWGTGPDDVYVAGTGGALAHFDGIAWMPIESGTGHNFRAAIAFDATTHFLTGDDAHEIASYRSGVTYLFDGVALNLLEMEFSGGRPNNDIWGRSRDDVVVAVDGCPQFFDGMDWQPECGIPAVSGNLEQFAVYGFGPDDLYFGQVRQFTHLDRLTKTYTPYPTAGTVRDLWVSPAQVVYAVTAGDLNVLDGQLQPPVLFGENVRPDIETIWGTSDNNVWVAGERVYHFDGASFVEHERPDRSANQLHDLWGTAADDVYAVGEAGTILHFDGTLWERQAGAQVYAANHSGGGWSALHGTTADDLVASAGDVFIRSGSRWEPLERGSIDGTVHDVWGAGSTDAWAVGSAIWHWDGNTGGDWDAIASPTTARLNRLHGLAPGDFYIAADDATLLHYNGVSFHQITLPITGAMDLNDVWVAASDRVFVAADDATILLFNGSSWGVHTIDAIDPNANVTALWGEVIDNVISVYAVTDFGDLLRWAGGANWSLIDTGLPATGRSFFGLWAVRGANTFDLFAVGRSGGYYSEGLVMHMQNGGVSEQVFVDTRALLDVHGLSREQVFAVSGYRAELLGFDGSQWTLQPEPGAEVLSELGALGVAGNRLLAGGRDFIMRYAGRWEVMMRNMDEIGDFPDVQRTVDGEIYAAGQHQSFSSWRVYHHNGMTWQRLDYGHLANASRCSRFWTDGTEFFILCARDDNTLQSAVHHFDGSDWRTMDFPGQGGFEIWGTSAADVFTVGADGAIAHYDGNAQSIWVPMASGVDADLRVLHGFGPNDVIAGGEGGLLLHYDGAQWTPMPTPLPTNTYLNLDIRSLYLDPATRTGVAGILASRSLALRNGVWENLGTVKSRAFVRGTWTDGGKIFFATTSGEILRADVATVFENGFESPPPPPASVAWATH